MQKPAPTEEEEDRRRRTVTLLQGSIIISLGTLLSFIGFRYGLKKQIEQAKENEQVVVNPKQIGPSGVPARQLALRALGRGSAIAIVMASVAGIGLSYWVESRQRPISKEENDQAMKELLSAMGIQEDGKDLPPSSSTSK